VADARTTRLMSPRRISAASVYVFGSVSTVCKVDDLTAVDLGRIGMEPQRRRSGAGNWASSTALRCSSSLHFA
jgi:hypothetical protein